MGSVSTVKKSFILANDSDDDDDEFLQPLDAHHRTLNSRIAQSSVRSTTLSKDAACTAHKATPGSIISAKPFSKLLALEAQDILGFQRKVGSTKLKKQIVSTLAAVGGAYTPLCNGSSFVVWTRYTELSAKALDETRLLLDRVNAAEPKLHCPNGQVKSECVRSSQKVGFRLPLPSQSKRFLPEPPCATIEPKTCTPLLSDAERLALSVLTATESNASLQSEAYSLSKMSAHSSPDMLLDIYDEDIDVFFENETSTKSTWSTNKRPRDGSTEEEEEASAVPCSRYSLSAAVLHRQNEHTRVHWMTN